MVSEKMISEKREKQESLNLTKFKKKLEKKLVPKDKPLVIR